MLDRPLSIGKVKGTNNYLPYHSRRGNKCKKAECLAQGGSVAVQAIEVNEEREEEKQQIKSSVKRICDMARFSF